MRLDSNHKGVWWALLAPALYTFKAAILKATLRVELEAVVFLHFLVGFFILLPFFIRHRRQLSTQKKSLYFFRGLLSMISIQCSVYGLRHLAFMDAILLENTISLFIPLVAGFWYGQRISLYSWFLLASGFFCVFLILKPHLDLFHFSSFSSLGCALFSAITAIALSVLSKTEHPLSILFYFHLWGILLSAIPLCFHWKAMASVSGCWVFFLPIALLGILFQYARNRAFSLLSPHIVGNFTYFSVLFSAMLGWVIWEEKMGLMQILGGGGLVCIGFLVSYQARIYGSTAS